MSHWNRSNLLKSPSGQTSLRRLIIPPLRSTRRILALFFHGLWSSNENSQFAYTFDRADLPMYKEAVRHHQPFLFIKGRWQGIMMLHNIMNRSRHQVISLHLGIGLGMAVQYVVPNEPTCWLIIPMSHYRLRKLWPREKKRFKQFGTSTEQTMASLASQGPHRPWLNEGKGSEGKDRNWLEIGGLLACQGS